MFSGIIKSIGTVSEIYAAGSNITFQIKSDIVSELHIDQSIAHNGVCLTIEEINEESYKVTAVKETLLKTNLGKLNKGDLVNLEQSITLQTMLDGHIVQGHVDATAVCINKNEEQGSWLFSFQYPVEFRNLIIEKGSVAVNGVSLTAFNCIDDKFSVAIIPYTFSNTNFLTLRPKDLVNIEFDIIGKYIQRSLSIKS
jgi:riboflavin synthase